MRHFWRVPCAALLAKERESVVLPHFPRWGIGRWCSLLEGNSYRKLSRVLAGAVDVVSWRVAMESRAILGSRYGAFVSTPIVGSHTSYGYDDRDRPGTD